MLKIISIFGTRPEAIKMAPVLLELNKHQNIEHKICITGQHMEMLDQVLQLFEIEPDFNLRIMKEAQSLNDITTNILRGLDPILEQFCPDLILVHGDTATTLAASLSAFFRKIDIAHIEAGLRTGDLYSPWPEEANRRLTSVVSSLHFAPTEQAKINLRAENVSLDSITVTGNTVIDALLAVQKRIKSDLTLQQVIKSKYNQVNFDKKIILITGHRRENFGSGFQNICDAISRLSSTYSDVEFIYPVHLNPNVREPVFNTLSGKKNIHLLPPLEYSEFVFLMMRSHIILTDSGGIQEEAPALGKPVLLMRDTTERPEAIDAGTTQLVGTNEDKIYAAVSALLENSALYEKMSSAVNPYGDGTAARQIICKLEEKYDI